ncbi:MAG: hypothetical protein HDR03_09415 [Lachnospiraceae bacterium]|nr:hypothetical protein [Lachnospiraceae bacterium]
MTENKQKLINLVSALEEENIIDYCYTFIGLKIYGKARLPEEILVDLRKMYDEYLVSCGYIDDEEPELHPEQEQESSEHIPEEREECIAELLKEIEGIQNIAKIRLILGIVQSYKKGGVEV